MQNIKKIITAAIFLVLVTAVVTPALAQDFPDLRGHWAASEVNQMAEKGIIGGYPDGNFYPNKSISRRELTKIVFSLFPAASQIDTNLVATYPDYPDLHSGWGQEHLKTGVLFMPGYTDGFFKPDQPATRHDVATLTLAAAMVQEGKYHLEQSQLLLQFTPADQSAWEKMVAFKEFAGLPAQYQKTTAYWNQDPDKTDFYGSASYFYSHLNPIALLAGQGILRGFDDGTLGLDKEVSRAETVVILSRMQNASLTNSDKYILEPAGLVHRPQTVTVDARTVETSLNQVGTFFKQKYSDPVKRAQTLYNLMLHTFSYDWETRQGLKDYTYTDIPSLMNTGLGTDQGLTLYYVTLAEKAGLKATVIQGQATNNGDQGNHSWVELTLGGDQTILVDPTYGVCTGTVFFNNFEHWRNQGYDWVK